MISTVTYNGDGVTRIFPVAFEIKGEEYTVVYVGGVAIADRSLYDIINNSIVFNTAPVTGTNNVEIVVASTTTEIADLNAPPSTIQTVLDNIDDINAIAASVIPNLPEILLADNNATIATTKAGEALVSASEALASKNSALTSANNALTSENNADTSEANALSYKNSAEVSATSATTQAGIAAAKAGEASTSASQALGYKDLAFGYRNEAETFAGSIDPNSLVENSIHASSSKTIPIDADEMGLIDSASTFTLKKLTWANLKATLKTYFDTLYQVILVSGTNIKTINSVSLLGSGNIVVGETAWTANDSRAKTALNASGTAPIYACRAWVNFNGTGTVAIRASGNVSSITDNGAGDYTVNFTTAMPDVNYVPAIGRVGSSSTNSGIAGLIVAGDTSGTSTPLVKTSTSIQLRNYVTISALGDSTDNNISFFR